MTPVPLVNAFSVDVEDYFQVSAFEPHVGRDDWESLPHRVEANTHRVLDLLAEFRVVGTFFVLGWVAERYPQVVHRLVAEGHELASHGYHHVRVTQQSPDDFYQDITRTKGLLEDTGGVAVRGYRAASYSIGATNLWALEQLARSGHIYSSSIYPIRHDHYGMPEAPRFAFHPPNAPDLLEIPISTVTVAGRNVPCGGGGYFRLLPYGVSRWLMGRINTHEQRPCVFYFHPWEIDPGQPRIAGLDIKTRVRHYLNLGAMEGRLRRLLADFAWSRMDRVFLDWEALARDCP